MSLSSFVYFNTNVSKLNLCFLVDTGASISVLRNDRIFENVYINPDYKASISGITDDKISTLGTIKANIFANNAQFSHFFQIVDDKFPVPVDGILGFDFISKFKGNLDYENWSFTFYPYPNCDYAITKQLISQNKINLVLLPPRTETLRPMILNTKDEYVFVPDQQIFPNVYVSKAIVSTKNPKIFVLNLNSHVVALDDPEIKYESLHEYDVYTIKKTSKLYTKSARVIKKKFSVSSERQDGKIMHRIY